MPMDGIEKLKLELNHLYIKYHRAELLGEDPLGLVSPHLTTSDFELVSYVSASLSYGRVEQIRKSLIRLWSRLEKAGLKSGGEGLHSFLVDNSGTTLKKEFKPALKGWIHRFNNEEDILILFQVLQIAAKAEESLGEIYAHEKTQAPTEKF